MVDRKILLTLALSGSFFPISLFASTGGLSPAGVAGFDPAGASCRADDLQRGPSLDTRRDGDLPVDGRCLLTTEKMVAMQSRMSPLIVDLRNSNAYGVSHIDGAINLGPNELKTKPYWKGKSMVLVGAGKGDLQVLQLCSGLRADGYSEVYVLQGGMAAWAREGRPENGRGVDIESRMTLSPEELFAETRDSTTLFVISAPLRALRSVLGVGEVESVVDAAHVETILKEYVQAGRSKPMRVVIATSSRFDDRELKNIAQRIYPLPLLVYREGVQKMEEFVRGHRLSLVAYERGPKRPSCGL